VEHARYGQPLETVRRAGPRCTRGTGRTARPLRDGPGPASCGRRQPSPWNCPCLHHHSPGLPPCPSRVGHRGCVADEQRREPPGHRSRQHHWGLRRTDEHRRGRKCTERMPRSIAIPNSQASLRELSELSRI